MPKQKVHSQVVGSRNVSGEKVLDLRDVLGFPDGGVSAAYLKEAALQRVLTDHHSEQHSHLIIPTTHRHGDTRQSTARDDSLLMRNFASIATVNYTLLCVQLLH